MNTVFTNKVAKMTIFKEHYMSTNSFTFKPFTARRLPDPNFKASQNTERHIFVINVRDIPLDLPNDANARDPNIAKKVYQEVQKNLLNLQSDIEINTFHLRNKGIIIIADSVIQKNDHDYEIKISEGKGICDGGHTYKLISDHIKLGDLPESQFVNVEIRTGIRDEWIAPIAGGLNTAVQVSQMSLRELEGNFIFIKKQIGEAVCKKIAWTENEDGVYDARDIVAMINMFSIEKPSFYPLDESNHPIQSYTGKAAVLDKFREKTDSFVRVQGILKDILVLHDSISYEAGKKWNDLKKAEGGKGGAGRLRWMEYDEKGRIEFPFINKKGTTSLANGALYPILAAFRNYVKQDKLGNMEWKVPFDQVLLAWDEIGEEMLTATADMMTILKDPNALGKAKVHWNSMFNIVKSHAK
jgi:hypothetical protein